MDTSDYVRLFDQICPPPSEVFNSLLSACPFAQILKNNEECIYRPICANSEAAMKVLRKVYTPDIRVTLTESSSSIVVRSEHQYSGDHRLRLSLRKHFYEMSGRIGGHRECGSDCEKTEIGHPLGRYLGFVDLRPNSKDSPLAMGLLVPPRSLRHDPQTRLSLGEYGPIFGGHGFACSVYSMHEPTAGGADCGQACALMALANLSDRGAQVTGPFALTYLARTKLAGAATPNCPVSSSAPSPSGSFRIDGMLPQALAETLDRCGASGIEVGMPDNSFQRAHYERLIEAYVLARCPVVLFVDFAVWCKTNGLTPRHADSVQQTEPHAVYVVGFSRKIAESRGLLASLIVHDPGSRPYLKASAEGCFAAMSAYDPSTNGHEARMHAVFAADQAVVLHAPWCVQALTRNLQSKEKFCPYFERRGEMDYRIRLVHRDDLLSAFFPQARADARATGPYEDRYLQTREKLKKRLRDLPRTSYWGIAAYDSKKNLDVLWLFDVGSQPDVRCPWTACVDVIDVDVSIGVSASPRITLPVKERRLGGRDDNPTTISRLGCSVLTSSSDLPLAEFFRRIVKTCGLRRFDLMILRDQDIRQIELETKLLPAVAAKPDSRTVTALLAEDENLQPIGDWLLRQCHAEQDIQISALATYFPDISSANESRRKVASQALGNTMRLALRLAQEGVMKSCIVEIVAGTLLDRCTCDTCAGTRIWEFDQTKKIELLLQSLRKVSQELAGETETPFGFAVELEPGDTYVVRDEKSLTEFAAQIGDAMGNFKSCVGINVDIAHMRAAGVRSEFLESLRHLIMHSHVCDLPFRMHTKDQPVGRWSAVNPWSSDLAEYLSVLADRALAQNDSENRLFSRALAIELEGCGRMSWIDQSIGMLGQMGLSI